MIALYRRSGASSCGHSEHTGIVAALEQRDHKTVQRLVTSHIDHIEADLDLRVGMAPSIKEALEL